jgi:hypothetical protein
MKSSVSTTANPVVGLALLMMHEKSTGIRFIDDCAENINSHTSHPFDFSLPTPDAGECQRIEVVKSGSSDTDVDIFLALIRHYVGDRSDTLLTKLRVINCPTRHDVVWHRHFFFEVWTGLPCVLISGMTTNFSGAGNTAREKLGSVFAALSLIHKLEIEHVKLQRVLTKA